MVAVGHRSSSHEPSSPRVAVTQTTRRPSRTPRAISPAATYVSSSGCAQTPRMVPRSPPSVIPSLLEWPGLLLPSPDSRNRGSSLVQQSLDDGPELLGRELQGRVAGLELDPPGVRRAGLEEVAERPDPVLAGDPNGGVPEVLDRTVEDEMHHRRLRRVGDDLDAAEASERVGDGQGGPPVPLDPRQPQPQHAEGGAGGRPHAVRGSAVAAAPPPPPPHHRPPPPPAPPPPPP